MEMDFTYSNEKFLVKFQKNDYWLYFLESRKYELKDYFFKIHISATVYNYKEIFKVVLPILFEKKVQFKIINGEKHLEKINTGEYGYSQIGKIITIYPENETELMYLLEELYRKTKGYSSIEIPSDFRYKNSEVVYYRYGEFIDSGGKDKRVKTIPSDIYNPILDYSIKRYRRIPEEYHLIKILSARGKSKVYMAIDKTDFSVVIIKEGIAKGEINSLGYDGFDNVYYEKEIFNELKEFNFFPRVKTYFYSSNNFCIVEEFIKGDTLSEIMLEKKYDLDIPWILLEILYNTEKLHKKNIVIYDLSPNNIIVYKNRIYFIDFEYYLLDANDKRFDRTFGTKGFFKQELDLINRDLYAVLSIIYYFLNPQEYTDLKDITTDKNMEVILGCSENEFFEKEYTEKIKIIKEIIVDSL